MNPPLSNTHAFLNESGCGVRYVPAFEKLLPSQKWMASRATDNQVMLYLWRELRQPFFHPRQALGMNASKTELLEEQSGGRNNDGSAGRDNTSAQSRRQFKSIKLEFVTAIHAQRRLRLRLAWTVKTCLCSVRLPAVVPSEAPEFGPYALGYLNVLRDWSSPDTVSSRWL